MTLAALPKVELHLHLDCSMSYRAMARLVPGLTADEYSRDYVAPARCANLLEFLNRSRKGVLLLQDEPALKLVVEDVFEQLQADGIIYAEIRFAPLLHTQSGLSPERVVEIVNEASEHMSVRTKIDARLILCTMRHFDEQQSLTTAKLVRAYRGSRVAALDIAGDEAGFPLTAHIAAFDYAKQHNLFRTAHAGEASGPESVWETLHLLDPTRIGHGVRSIEDTELVAYLRQNRIHLELCPSSNVQIIPSIQDFAHHPIDRLYRDHVPLNINTDTRMLTPITLTSEYEQVHRVFGWGLEEFHHTNRMAVEAAFLDQAAKQELRVKIDQAYQALGRS